MSAVIVTIISFSLYTSSLSEHRYAFILQKCTPEALRSHVTNPMSYGHWSRAADICLPGWANSLLYYTTFHWNHMSR